MVEVQGEWGTVSASDLDDFESRPGLQRANVRSALIRAGAGYAAITAVMLGVGLILTHLLSNSVGRWDQSVNTWFADNRSSETNNVTAVTTLAVNTLPAIGLAAVIFVVLALTHRWRAAVFVVLALALEVAVFLSVTFVIARPRPDVPRLNATPSTSSFPSGHTAAATVLFVGVAVVVYWCTSKRPLRIGATTVAVLLVTLVALGRVYRGLHHPSDVIIGVLLGVACLWTSAYATSALRAHRSFRDDLTTGTTDRLSNTTGGPSGNNRGGRPFGQDAPGRADPAA